MLTPLLLVLIYDSVLSFIDFSVPFCLIVTQAHLSLGVIMFRVFNLPLPTLLGHTQWNKQQHLNQQDEHLKFFNKSGELQQQYLWSRIFIFYSHFQSFKGSVHVILKLSVVERKRFNILCWMWLMGYEKLCSRIRTEKRT